MEELTKTKWKIKRDYKTKDFYNFYKSTVRNPLPYKTVVNFLYGKTNIGLIEELKNEIVYNAYSLHLPHRLGIIRVRKKEPKIHFNNDGSLNYKKSMMRVDWKATKELWEKNPEAKKKKTRVFHLNKHTDGAICSPVWEKYSSNVKNKTVYKFLPVRSFYRQIPKALSLKDSKIDYFG